MQVPCGDNIRFPDAIRLPDVDAIAADAVEPGPFPRGGLCPLNRLVMLAQCKRASRRIHQLRQLAEALVEQVREREGSGGYQCLKGLPPTRFGGVLARRSITTDSLHDYGGGGLMLICTNAGKASVFSLLRQSCAGADRRPMSWPADESRYGPVEFEGICSESLQRTVDKRTGRTALSWKKTTRLNEPLDLLVYSLAMVSHLGIPFMLAERELIEESANAHHAIAA